MKEKVAGIVTLGYNEEGEVIETIFEPTKETGFDRSILEKLKAVKSSDDTEKIKRSAANILAQWLNQINELDMADHFEYGWEAKLLDCVKYAGGKVKRCSIQYTFKKLGNAKVV